MRNSDAISLCFTFLILMSCSCNSKPERKKMPALSGLSAMVNEKSQPSAEFPFIVGDTLLNGGHFFSITVRDASSDSIGLAMLQTYLPIASFLYDALVRAGNKGVLINLCVSNTSLHMRVDLILRYKDEFSLAVVLLCDEITELRMTEFLNELIQLPNIQFNITGNNNLEFSGKYSTENCFQFPLDISLQ